MALQNNFFTGQSGGATSPTLLDTPRGQTAGGVYMAQLGTYQFALETSSFQSLQRSTEFRWAALPRIGRAPAHQFLGLGEDSIELQGVIFPHFRGGLGQLGLMRAQAGAGDPLALTYAFENVGQFVGRWCIVSVHEGRTEFLRDGRPKKIEFTLKLQAYGEDEGTQDAVVQLITSMTGTAIPSAALQPPPLAGEGGTALAQSAAVAEVAPAITGTVTEVNTLPKIHLVADSLSQSALAVAKLAKSASSSVENSVAALTGEVLAAIPIDAARQINQAAKDLLKSGHRLVGMSSDVAAEMGVLRDFPVEIKRTAAEARQKMEEVLRDVTRIGASAKSVSSVMSRSGSGATTPRLTAAAAVSAIARSADHLLFASTEGARQMSVIDSKVTTA